MLSLTAKDIDAVEFDEVAESDNSGQYRWFDFSSLLGAHKLALEAYQDAEDEESSPDWDIYHNKGTAEIKRRVAVKSGDVLFLEIYVGNTIDIRWSRASSLFKCIGMTNTKIIKFTRFECDRSF